MPTDVSWKDRPEFFLDVSRDELEAALGPPEATDADSNGLGPMEVWSKKLPCGLELGLLRFRYATPTGRPLGPDEPAAAELYLSDGDGAHAALHMQLPLERLQQHSAGVALPLPWCVMRQDDNGNRFEVTRCSSRCEAEARAAEFEARGHKQMYWVEA